MCISIDMWRKVDNRVCARRTPAQKQKLIRCLGQAINVILKGKRIRRTEEAGEDLELLLGADPPLHKEAWNRMKGWYKDEVDRVMLPS